MTEAETVGRRKVTLHESDRTKSSFIICLEPSRQNLLLWITQKTGTRETKRQSATKERAVTSITSPVFQSAGEQFFYSKVTATTLYSSQ